MIDSLSNRKILLFVIIIFFTACQLFFVFRFSVLPTKIFFRCVFTIAQQLFKRQLRDCARSMLLLFLFPLGSELARDWAAARRAEPRPLAVLTADSRYFESQTTTKKMKQKQSFCIVCTRVSRPVICWFVFVVFVQRGTMNKCDWSVPLGW